MAYLYKTQEEITELSIKNGDTSRYLSDQRTALFGSNRRTDIIGYSAQQNSSTKEHQYYHDEWEEFLRSQSINNSKYIEEEKSVFHKISNYP